MRDLEEMAKLGCSINAMDAVIEIKGGLINLLVNTPWINVREKC